MSRAITYDCGEESDWLTEADVAFAWATSGLADVNSSTPPQKRCSLEGVPLSAAKHSHPAAWVVALGAVVATGGAHFEAIWKLP